MYCQQEFIEAGTGIFPIRHEVYVGQGKIANQRFIHEGILLGYDIEGATLEQTDAGEYFVLPGQVICLPPQTWHTVTEDGGKPLQSIWMELVGPAAESLIKLFGTFSAPRDDTARASCGNGAKRKLLSFTFRTPPPGERHIEDHAAGPSIFSTFSNPIRAVKQISDFSPTVADIQFPGRIPAAPAL